MLEARYTRIFTDEHGASRFEDLRVELLPGMAVPPAEPLHTAPFLAAEKTFWIGAPTDWKGDAAHPAPRRMIFVTLQGEYRVTASESATRTFPVGSVLLLEDTAGSGHSTSITSGEAAIVLAVALSPATQ